MVVSKRFELNFADIKRVAKNALIFAGPALLVLIGSFVDYLPKDAKYYAMILWAANTLVDLIRKYLSENKYK